jgi:hypothetical protein
MASQFAISAAQQSDAGTEAEDQIQLQVVRAKRVGKPDLQIICKPCGIQMRAKTEAPVVVTPPSEAIPVVEPVKRKRGRPKGSKNKPKSVVRTNEAA